MIRGIMKELSLAKADGVKFEPNMKGRRKIRRKPIIDMNSQEAQIIDYVVESGMSTLNTWSFFNYHREVEELPPVYISAAVTCIYKIKPLV